MTGFHLVDGKERVIVLEGLAEGAAMNAVKVGPVERWIHLVIAHFINPLTPHLRTPSSPPVRHGMGAIRPAS